MIKQENKTMARMVKSLGVAATCAALLAGCGGGGGGGVAAGTPAQNLVNPTAILQNFWAGTITNGPEASTRVSAIVMPDLTTWVAFETGAAVVGVGKATTTGTATSETTATIASSGFYYSLTGAARQALTASGTATATAINATTTAPGASTIALAPVAGFTTAATQANLTGRFVGNLGGGAVQVTWVFDAAGNLVQGIPPAGSASSTGCTYAGTVKPNAAAIAVYDVAVTETCPGATRTMAGVATYRAAAGAVPASLRVIFTADAGVTGGLLALDKQPI